MDNILEILLIMLISSVKFLAGPPIAYYGQIAEFNFLETNLICITGGTTGIMFFMFLSEKVRNFIRSLFKIKHESNQIKFSKRNRQMIRFWRSYGLIGVAFITPVLLSIPVGTFIAIRLNKNKKKIFIYLFGSIVLWSLIITSVMEFFKEINFDDLKVK